MFNFPKNITEKEKNRKSGLKLTSKRIKTSKGRMKKGAKHENGIKRSQQIDKITIANAAVKAFMPFILKSIVQRRIQKQQAKVMYIPVPNKSGDTNVLMTQNILPSVASIGPEPNVPPPSPLKMLPSVPSIGPEPNVPPQSPPKMLPSVPSIGPEPNVPPPSPKLQSSKPSSEKDPVRKPAEKNKSVKNKSEKDEEKKEEDKKKKDDKKQDKKEKEKVEKQELKEARKGQGRHLTPKLYPFHLEGMAQMANYKKNEKAETISNGKGYVLVPHHEEDKTDRTEEYFQHYED